MVIIIFHTRTNEEHVSVNWSWLFVLLNLAGWRISLFRSGKCGNTTREINTFRWSYLELLRNEMEIKFQNIWVEKRQQSTCWSEYLDISNSPDSWQFLFILLSSAKVKNTETNFHCPLSFSVTFISILSKTLGWWSWLPVLPFHCTRRCYCVMQPFSHSCDPLCYQCSFCLIIIAKSARSIFIVQPTTDVAQWFEGDHL